MDNLEVIKIKKGLDIPIPGTAERHTTLLFPSYDGVQYEYAVKPTDYVGVAPRLLVAEGDDVLAGTPLFEDKNNEGVPFVSPVSGTVKAIVRGEKRALFSVIVEANEGLQRYCSFPKADPQESDADTIREIMVTSGLWNSLRQRPFSIVPRKGSTPKAIFISAFDSSPLPVDYDYMLQQDSNIHRRDDFQWGINALAKFAPVHLSLDGKTQRNSFFAKTENAEIHFFEGPHPAGLVGTQIAKISPINKGETVWTINVQDVAIIGNLLHTGTYNPERVVAFCGPDVSEPKYYRLISGSDLPGTTLKNGSGKQRIICGDVLSGVSMQRTKNNIESDSYISASCDKVCFIPEGDYYDFMGWLRPNFRKYSFYRTYLSGILSKFRIHNSKLDFDTGMHGSVRPLFVTGEFEKLVPLDIYPMQLIKACIIGDIELMENLGIYEVEPEDLALCEFADTSKTEIQAIIREGLEKIRKEVV
ncbi:MAG: Na(+)-translocating NADH-quinone reductase subunit A [Bacteroidales bacterium]|nr:Na(+)-translocating NADH-quinone reductase subunit A [Bacteroidales bacterium]